MVASTPGLIDELEFNEDSLERYERRLNKAAKNDLESQKYLESGHVERHWLEIYREG